jgi:hypothetical protein
MTLKEKLAVTMKSIELEKIGKKEESLALDKTMPLPPFLAKVIKEKVGADFLIDGGWNLLEAEEKYGKDWLNK